MELSKEIIDGLTNIQNSNILSDETFLQLLGITIAYICENTNDVKSNYRFHTFVYVESQIENRCGMIRCDILYECTIQL